jgi:hypothetical protein
MKRSVFNSMWASAAAVFALTVGTGCNSVLDTSRGIPDRAEVTVTGTSSVPLRLLMSNRFTATWNEQDARWAVSLLAADTTTITSLPVTRTLPLNEFGVFFVRLTQPDLDATADIEMTVRMDGDQVYVQRAALTDASLEYVWFTN